MFGVWKLEQYYTLVICCITWNESFVEIRFWTQVSSIFWQRVITVTNLFDLSVRFIDTVINTNWLPISPSPMDCNLNTIIFSFIFLITINTPVWIGLRTNLASVRELGNNLFRWYQDYMNQWCIPSYRSNLDPYYIRLVKFHKADVVYNMLNCRLIHL